MQQGLFPAYGAYFTLLQELPNDQLLNYVLSLSPNHSKDLQKIRRQVVLNSIFTGCFGIGDRHLDNVAVQQNFIINIDLEQSFFSTMLLQQPEYVSFRFTPLL